MTSLSNHGMENEQSYAIRQLQPDDETTGSINSDHFNHDGGNNQGHDNNKEAAEAAAEVKALVKRENKAVFYLRIVVILVLLCAAVISSGMVYKSFKDKEYEAFLEEYEAISSRVIENYRNDILQKLWVAEDLSCVVSTLLAAANNDGGGSGNSTSMMIPNFEKIVQAALVLAPVHAVRWSPLVHEDATDPSRVTSSPLYQVVTYHALQKHIEEDDELHMHLEQEELEDMPLMTNLLTHPKTKDALNVLINSKGPVMSKTYMLLDANDEEEEESEVEDEEHDHGRKLDSSDDSDEDEDEDGLHSNQERAVLLLFPVFDSNDNTTLLGSLSFEVVWSNFLSGNLLAASELNRVENIFDADEVDVVFENTCGQVYTIKVDEAALELVSEGDVHEREYDYLALATSFEEFDDDFALFGFNAMGSDTEDSHCRYRFSIYPTKELEEEHQTKEPLLFAVIVGLIFIFTSSIFLMYDIIASRRQKIITKRALKTNAIVASFFPAAVRNRLYDEAADSYDKSTSAKEGGESRLRGFLMENPKKTKDISSEPIADLFNDCTVLFADIAGFTAWSSGREPSQVFKLLERTFSDFDRAAKKLGVFKVETIGDCYLAVTGLPTPREDHAVVAAKFAHVILQQMHVLCKDLEKTLGPSTRNLVLRIGLHSGSVTAGVLRGEKSRFQLFGDTINTASRMESNGLPGKIHVSSDTADLLKQSGKSHWLTEREGTIVAKGKGEMKTFFVHVGSSSAATDSKGSASDSNSLSDNIEMPSSPNETETTTNNDTSLTELEV